MCLRVIVSYVPCHDAAAIMSRMAFSKLLCPASQTCWFSLSRAWGCQRRVRTANKWIV